MGDHTGIEWCDATWNPIVGCSIVSPGCTNCYAMRMAARIERMRPGSHYAGTTQPSKAGPVWTGRLAQAPDSILTAPLRWKRARRIFVNSMSDLFHPAVTDAWIDRIFAIMALAPQHTFQVLTKRPERMREYLAGPYKGDGVAARIADATWSLAPKRAQLPDPPRIVEVPVGPRLPSGLPEFGFRRMLTVDAWPFPNVWLGVSVEDQRRADERWEHMRVVADAGWLTWVSYEPALGPVDWAGWKFLRCVVSGGESGKGARPAHPDWHRAARDWCDQHDVAYLFKQFGEWAPGETVTRTSGSIETASYFNDEWSFERENLASEGGHIDDEPDVYRVGKHAAGRLLDGVEHNGMPGGA